MSLGVAGAGEGPSRAQWYLEKVRLLPQLQDIVHCNPHDANDPINVISRPELILAAFPVTTIGAREGRDAAVWDGHGDRNLQQRRFGVAKRRDEEARVSPSKRARDEPPGSGTGPTASSEVWSAQQFRQSLSREQSHVLKPFLDRASLVYRNPAECRSGCSSLQPSSTSSFPADRLLAGADEHDVYKVASAYLKRVQWIAERRALGVWDALTEAQRAAEEMRHVDDARKFFSRARKAST